MKKKYLVSARQEVMYEKNVEAESEEEALCRHGQLLLRCKSTQSHIGTVIII